MHVFGPKGTDYQWRTPFGVVVGAALEGHTKPLEQALSLGVDPLVPSVIVDDEKGTTQTALGYVASRVLWTQSGKDWVEYRNAAIAFNIINTWLEGQKITPERIKAAY